MMKLYIWIILLIIGVSAQENALRNVAPSLRECYDNRYLFEKDNRLPHTMNTLIAIIRKIENTEGLNMDLRSLTVAILHRFRQDGIVENPTIPKQLGVSPYASDIDQSSKFFHIRRFIPEKDNLLPLDIMNEIDRCSLHFMLSSSIEIYERHDEGTTCRFDNAYRRARSINNNNNFINAKFKNRDAEVLTSEQINNITSHKNEMKDDANDPNNIYPELPRNHPDIARLTSDSPSKSRCPVENGVIKTKWGPISAGSVIAGIAAGLQPEIIKLSDLSQDKPYSSELTLDNKWIATLAGDLAEVALIQGPRNEKLSVGVNGNWNSSAVPHWYFLSSNDKLEFTTAEIRGGLDGLIIANKIESLYSQIPSLKLSQILDMYYSNHGLVDPSIKACNRRTLFTEVAPNSTMSAQAYSAALILKEHLQKATIDDNIVEKFAVQATNELSIYIPSSMNKDLLCNDTHNDVELSADLTIILDTTWPYNLIQPILASLLDNMDINPYNSQFTIINGHNGSNIINATSNILEYGYYNITNYTTVVNNFDLAKSFEKLESLQRQKLNAERNKNVVSARSDIVLIIPYTSSVSDPDKEYSLQQIKKMHEQVPDATILILAYGPKDRWSDFVSNPVTDLFSTATIGNNQETSSTIFSLISRIKKVPKRLINTQCGADYSPVGNAESLTGYIAPATVVSYRLHPNYFFSSDTSHVSHIKIEGNSNLKVCTSRNVIKINSSSEDSSTSCKTLTDNIHTISFSCNGASFIHHCQPLYLSLIANPSYTPYQYTDTRARFPHMMKYTISYENLVCTSNASRNLLNSIILIISIIYIFT